MITELHLFREAEGSKFFMIQDINYAYAKKSQIIYTEYLPLLRELNQACALFSECINSECPSNAHVLHKLCSFTCPAWVFPEASLQSHCRHSQGSVCSTFDSDSSHIMSWTVFVHADSLGTAGLSYFYWLTAKSIFWIVPALQKPQGCIKYGAAKSFSRWKTEVYNLRLVCLFLRKCWWF